MLEKEKVEKEKTSTIVFIGSQFLIEYIYRQRQLAGFFKMHIGAQTPLLLKLRIRIDGVWGSHKVCVFFRLG